MDVPRHEHVHAVHGEERKHHQLKNEIGNDTNNMDFWINHRHQKIVTSMMLTELFKRALKHPMAAVCILPSLKTNLVINISFAHRNLVTISYAVHVFTHARTHSRTSFRQTLCCSTCTYSAAVLSYYSPCIIIHIIEKT